METPKKRKEFVEAYNLYYPEVLGILLSKISIREDAEDICHEVFIRFFKKFDEIKEYRKWLFVSIKYEILNYYQKEKKPSNIIDIDELKDDVNLAFQNGFRDARIIIKDTVNNLRNFKDEKEKMLFDLIAVFDFSYNDAADYMGMTRAKVEYMYKKIETELVPFLVEIL